MSIICYFILQIYISILSICISVHIHMFVLFIYYFIVYIYISILLMCIIISFTYYVYSAYNIVVRQSCIAENMVHLLLDHCSSILLCSLYFIGSASYWLPWTLPVSKLQINAGPLIWTQKYSETGWSIRKWQCSTVHDWVASAETY